jgi:hypothetical protein
MVIETRLRLWCISGKNASQFATVYQRLVMRLCHLRVQARQRMTEVASCSIHADSGGAMRFITGLCVLVISTPLAGQSAPTGPTDRGSKIIGGTASVSHTSGGGGSTGISLQPSLLHFIADRVALGGGVGLGYSDNDNGSTTSWRLGPEVRFYFGPSTSKTIPYLGAAVQVGSSSTDSDAGPGSVSADASFWGLEGVAGLTFMISRQVGIAGEAFLQRDELTFESALSDVTTSTTRFGLRFGIAAFVF